MKELAPISDEKLEVLCSYGNYLEGIEKTLMDGKKTKAANDLSKLNLDAGDMYVNGTWNVSETAQQITVNATDYHDNPEIISEKRVSEVLYSVLQALDDLKLNKEISDIKKILEELDIKKTYYGKAAGEKGNINKRI